AVLAGGQSLEVRGLLLRGAEREHDVDEREVAHDRGFVLQVVMQSQALGREVVANHGHREVRAILAAERLGQREAEMPRAVRAPAHLREELLPFPARPPVALPVGPRVLAAVVEELDVRGLERLDLALDEIVEVGELSLDVRRHREVHGRASSVSGVLRHPGGNPRATRSTMSELGPLSSMLRHVISARLGPPGTVENLVRLTGGATKATWSFDARVGSETLRLILQHPTHRTLPPEDPMPP